MKSFSSTALFGGMVAIAVLATATLVSAQETKGGITALSTVSTTDKKESDTTIRQAAPATKSATKAFATVAKESVVTGISGPILTVTASGSGMSGFHAISGTGIARTMLASNGFSWYLDNRGSNDVSLPANRLAISNNAGTELASFLQNGSLVLGIQGSSAYPNYRASDRLVLGTNSALAWQSNGSVTNRIYDNGWNGMTIQNEGSWWGALKIRSGYANGGDGDVTNQIAFSDGGGGVYTYFDSGNVGIGTRTPGKKLDVAGEIRSTTGGFVFPDGTTQTTAATGGSAMLFAGTPPKAQCDTAKIGRFALDTSAQKLYVCVGGKSGWNLIQTASVQ